MSSSVVPVFLFDVSSFAVNASSCAACCTAFSAQVAFGELRVPLANFIFSAVWLIALVVLLARIVYLNRRGLSMGYNALVSPVEALRASRHASTSRFYIPTFYTTYMVINSLFMLVEIIVALPQDSPAIAWAWRFLCGAREAFDVAIVAFLCLPDIRGWKSNVVPLIAAAVVLLIFSLFVIFAGETRPCPWCTQHWPSSNVSWLFLAEGVLCLIFAFWAWKRPSRIYNPRPAAAMMCGFWAPLYLSLATVLPVMDSLYPGQSVDWGYCLLLALLAMYYCLFPVVFYMVIVRDARYIYVMKLDSAFGSKKASIPGGLDGDDSSGEEQRRLVERHPAPEALAELLRDESLVLIQRGDLVMKERIGYGGFGEVHRALWKGTNVAVKMLLRIETRELQAFVEEMALLAKLRHPNIMLMVGMVLESGSSSLVTEYCTKGSLFDVMYARERVLTWRMKRTIMYQTATAMEYLHGRNVLHRDLKPGNILLTGEDYSARLSDFGLSRQLRARSATTVTGFGTIVYAAPEVLRQDLQGKSADVWSFGAVVWEVSAEKIPFDGVAVGALVMGLVNGTLSLQRDECLDGTPEVFFKCMDSCMKIEPEERPNFSEIVQMIK